MLLVQCDFDDTITVGIVSNAILEAFAEEGWQPKLDEYRAGKLSVERSNIRLFELVKASKQEIEEFVLGEVVVRYGFDEFVDYCQGEGIGLVIVSSGLDLYIRPPMEQMGFGHLEIYSGKASVTPQGVRVEYSDPSGVLITQGFKETYLRHFKNQGHTVIYVGDSHSDIVGATEADYAIARSSLEQHFKETGRPHYGFETFNDVGEHVEEIRSRVGA